MSSTIESRAETNTLPLSFPSPFTPRQSRLEVTLLAEVGLYRRRFESAHKLLELTTQGIESMQAKIQALELLLKEKSTKDDSKLTTREQIRLIDNLEKRIIYMSYLNMDPKITFKEIEALEKARKTNPLGSTELSEKEEVKKKSLTINKSEMEANSVKLVQNELPESAKPNRPTRSEHQSRLNELYEAVSSFAPVKEENYTGSVPYQVYREKQFERRNEALLITQQHNDDITPEKLYRIMDGGTVSGGLVDTLKNMIPKRKSSKENVPQIPAGALYFVEELRKKSASRDKSTKKNKKLLQIADSMCIQDSFTTGKHTNITAEDFGKMVNNRYDWEMDTGKAIKNSVFGMIKFVGGRLISKSHNNNTLLSSEIDHSKVIVPDLQPPASKPLDTLDTRKEKSPSQKNETLRADISRICTIIISTLEGYGSYQTSGYKKLKEYSATDDSAVYLKNISRQLQKTIYNYNLTPNIQKLNFLVISNAQILDTLAKLSPKSNNGGRVKKNPPLTDVRKLIKTTTV